MIVLPRTKYSLKEMSQINAVVECPNMEKGKRQIKPMAKALENKIERLQHERKSAVNKVNALIPQMKVHMKSKENAFICLLKNRSKPCNFGSKTKGIKGKARIG